LDSNELGTFFYLSLRDTFCDNIWQSGYRRANQ